MVMENNGLNKSVPEEQFSDNTENAEKNDLDNNEQPARPAGGPDQELTENDSDKDQETSAGLKSESLDDNQDTRQVDNESNGEGNHLQEETVRGDVIDINEEKETGQDIDEAGTTLKVESLDNTGDNPEINQEEKKAGKKVKKGKAEKKAEKEEIDTEKKRKKKKDENIAGKKENEEEQEEEKQEKEINIEILEPIDYTKLSKSDLIKCLTELLDNKSVFDVKPDVDIIKSSFYKKHKADIEKIKENFIKEGGNIEDFKPQDDAQELEFKELLNRYK